MVYILEHEPKLIEFADVIIMYLENPKSPSKSTIGIRKLGKLARNEMSFVLYWQYTVRNWNRKKLYLPQNL